jgi:hypothetical protein
VRQKREHQEKDRQNTDAEDTDDAFPMGEWIVEFPVPAPALLAAVRDLGVDVLKRSLYASFVGRRDIAASAFWTSHGGLSLDWRCGKFLDSGRFGPQFRAWHAILSTAGAGVNAVDAHFPVEFSYFSIAGSPMKTLGGCHIPDLTLR